MNNYFIILAYIIYLPLSISLTLYFARNLFKNGKVFSTMAFMVVVCSGWAFGVVKSKRLRMIV